MDTSKTPRDRKKTHKAQNPWPPPRTPREPPPTQTPGGPYNTYVGVQNSSYQTPPDTAKRGAGGEYDDDNTASKSFDDDGNLDLPPRPSREPPQSAQAQRGAPEESAHELSDQFIYS